MKQGIQHPEVVDLVAHSPADNVVSLLIVEVRAWDGSQQEESMLLEKVSAYLTYILDGELERQHPIALGARKAIKFNFVAEPPVRIQFIIGQLKQKVQDKGIDVSWQMLV